jgi:predicted nucleic acid-binding Zn ribbon protein
MKQSGLALGARRGEIAAAWSEAVGPEIAGRTRVAGLRARVLTVEVDGAPLRSELAAFHAQALLETLREAVPSARLSKIVFRLAPGRS